MRFFLATLLLLLIGNIGYCQEFTFTEFKVSDGLPTDVIKAVNQDSLGFFWIATDDGLVKYDGIHFTPYKNALKSRYAKGFIKTKKNKLLAIGDLDFVEIQNQIDTVIFKTLIRGSHNLTDSTISYPKTIYEDKDENIWIAESESVVKYKNGEFKRYLFGPKYRASEFDRSFYFFENKAGTLFIIANNGTVFTYKNDQLNQLAGKVCNLVNFVLNINETVYLASNDGLFTAKIDESGVKKVVKTSFPYGYVSKLLLGTDSSLMVSTYSYDLFKMDKYNKFEFKKIAFTFNDIRSCFLSKEGDYWISTHRGLILLQKKIFEIPYKDPKSKFIESIAQNPISYDIYFCDKERLSKLHQVNSSNWQKEDIYFSKEGYFQSLETNKLGLWAANGQKLMLFQNEKLTKTWDFTQYGYFIFEIHSDFKENLWIAQSRSPYVFELKPDFSLVKHQLPTNSEVDIALVKESEKGIYIIAKGNIKNFLFFKGHNDQHFVNLSRPLDIEIKGEFQICNLVSIGNTVWLATTQGLMKYENNTFKRVDLGVLFTNFVVSSVAQLDDENILFANSYGLFRYNFKTNEYWVYDENLGLPANTITDEGIFIDAQNRVWIGSSVGISYTTKKHLLSSSTTPKPYCVRANVNGNSVRFSGGIKAPYNAYIHLEFSSITFPANKISFSWKINDAKSDWQEFQNNELNFTELPSGKYEILIRAKKNTGLSWSEPQKIQITIDKPYWLKPWFIFWVIVCIIIIIWISYSVSAKILNKRKEYLQNQIKLKTHDLELANQELSQRNQELDRFVYSASHDLGAPLKSLLGLIAIAKMESDPDTLNKYHTMMESSVHKLDDFIKEVISYSRNSRMNLEFEEIDFKILITNLLEDHQYAENYKKIEIIIEDLSGRPMISDVSRLKIILNNLISNAIKFHKINGNIKPYIKISLAIENSNYIIKVEDNGRGIPKDYQEAIFEMFYRAAVDVQGSGLGLYILKETVIKLGGNCKVESEVGKGTIFFISIPIPDLNVSN